MSYAAPTIVTVEVDSAWVVILFVTCVTLVATLLLRRAIRRPGGLWSSLLMTLPLLLPLLAATIYQHGVLPEISVLRPIDASALRGADPGLLHLVMVANGRTSVPYLVLGSTGPYLFLIGVVVTALMLSRRFVGFVLLRRELRRCEEASPESFPGLVEAFHRATAAGGLKAAPRLLISDRGSGAFAVGGRRPAVVLAARLVDHLSDEEIDGVLAHELAHIEVRDIEVVSVARFLRDLVPWNPFAHIAFARLTTDRELEADRRAAAVTGNPLALASGLVKMCELLRGPDRTPVSALAFLRRRGTVKRRVARLLALADGGTTAMPTTYMPYIAAACIAVVLGLQAGAKIAAEDRSAVAFVFGSSAQGAPTVWDGSNPNLAARRAASASVAQREARARRRGQVVPLAGHGDLVRRFPMLAEHHAFRRGDVAKFFQVFDAYARRRGVLLRPLVWDAVPVWGGADAGVGVYRIESAPLRGL